MMGIPVRCRWNDSVTPAPALAAAVNGCSSRSMFLLPRTGALPVVMRSEAWSQ